MWRILLFAALLSMVALTTSFAAPFPDVPESHWASSSVQALKAKGILEGYPDGLYRGKRAASRYEMAMALSRVVAKLEQLESSLPDFSQFVTKDDLAAVKRMVDQNRQFIEELNVRTDALEKKVGELDKRLSKLEKLTVHGWYEMSYVNQTLEADQINNIGPIAGTTIYGWPANQRLFNFEATMAYSTALVGWNNGDIKPWNNYLFTRGWNALPISTAEGGTDVGYLKLHGKISDDWHINALLAGNSFLFTGLGAKNYQVLAVNGLTRFTGEGSWIAPSTRTQGLNDSFGRGNANVRFETVKLYNKDKSLNVTLGGFDPNLTEGFVFTGAPNPYLWDSKPHFAAYGFNIHHVPGKNLFGAELEHELYTGKVSQFDANTNDPDGGGPIAPFAYQMTQRVFGYALNFKLQKGYFKIMYNVMEDSQEEFRLQGTNHIMAMTTGAFLGTPWSWVTSDNPRLTDPMFDTTPGVAGGEKYGVAGGATPVGPQYQSTIGASLRYNISDRWGFNAKFATSNYQPVKELGLDTSGSMFAASVSGTWGNTTLKEYEEKHMLNPKSGWVHLEYLSVDPDYSPFIGVTNFFAVPNASNGFINNINYFASLYWGQLPYPVYQRVFNSDQLTYTAHDAKMYPNNREGVRIKVQYKFSDAFLGWAMYEGLTQVEESRDYDPLIAGTQVKWGFYDPIFGTNHVEGTGVGNNIFLTKKGTIDTFNAGFNYKFQGGKYDFTANYYNTNIKREIPAFVGTTAVSNANDNIDYTVTGYDVLFRFFANEKWTWHIAYTAVTGEGKYFVPQDGARVAQNTNQLGRENTSFENNALRVGFDWNVNENVNFFASYRFLNFESKAFQQTLNTNTNTVTNNIDNSDWKGNQLWLGARIKFGQK